jgi:hypothetical protein
MQQIYIGTDINVGLIENPAMGSDSAINPLLAKSNGVRLGNQSTAASGQHRGGIRTADFAASGLTAIDDRRLSADREQGQKPIWA